SGVGKSSLINHIFGINIAVRRCHNHRAGYADIDMEFVSEENRLFVLHDSKGFEPGELENFDTVRRFIEERSKKPLLKDRIHCLWYVYSFVKYRCLFHRHQALCNDTHGWRSSI
ncbi:hypothetical protein EI94DRAFT_1604614, partial [Lactarius quietus]